MKPWDGDRPLTPRIVLGEKTVAARGMTFRYATEQIRASTDWCCFDDSRHLVYVHRLGHLRSMETDLDWGPSGRTLPTAGDIWVVPAGNRCAALVEGDAAGYCEIAIPHRLLGSTPLIPRIKHRDPLIHQLVDKIAGAADRDDALARLLQDTLAETVRLLITDKYTVTPPERARGACTLDARARSLLVEFLEDSLDSEIHLESLAALVGMPVSKFIKAFRAAFHTTPYQFVLDRRIDRAKTLLLTTSRTITDISAAVGFSTPNHFATAFSRRVGVSPRSYRNNH
ncbi:helix-turn-helix transcriptional regulator [Mycolicibacterium sp.]|uniref:helix-turn-helix transcriptional regulator n=1 Tax=Mycolicibacterium sp. TaxID=2320850 RepID=UPI0037C5C458